MDQKRLILAIAISIAILLGFQLLIAPHLPQPPEPVHARTAELDNAKPAPEPGSGPVAGINAPNASQAPEPKNVPRVKIDAPSVKGSISLVGARLDDLVLRDYRETLAPELAAGAAARAALLRQAVLCPVRLDGGAGQRREGARPATRCGRHRRPS